LRKDNRAVSPAISTVIMTAALVVLVLVTVSYENNYLRVNLAGNEFSANKQFMQATGLQIDDAAWTIGRTQTIDYVTRYGQVTFVPNALSYTFEVNTGSSWQTVLNCTTGMILFNLPVTSYNLGKNYFAVIFPTNNGSILQWGSSAPVSQVFATEKIPMAGGSYARVVTIPIVRLLNSTISAGTQNYYKFYLPSLTNGTSPHLSQSVTLTGSSISKVTPSGPITQIRINATSLAAPTNPPGFDSSFFNFDHTTAGHATETVNISPQSLVEIYTGNVVVSLGLN
jgi:hypothetical protein